MVTGLYGALAASASVFIGILTALLASNLSNLKSERGRIRRRIETIDARLESLDNQYETLQEQLQDVIDWEESNEAQDRVDEFIDNHVGAEFNPDNLNIDLVRQEFSDFLGVDDLNEYQEEALLENYEEIREELTPDTTGYGLMGAPLPDSAVLDSEIVAANHQIENRWEIHMEERFNRDYRRFIQTNTEIQSLRQERQDLVNRYQSLDPTDIIDTLRAAVVSIGLSVGVPLSAYFFHAVFENPLIQLPNWIEPTVVFLLWGGGLAYVFYHLSDELGGQSDPLPDEPELAVDEENRDTSEPDNVNSEDIGQELDSQ